MGAASSEPLLPPEDPVTAQEQVLTTKTAVIPAAVVGGKSDTLDADLRKEDVPANQALAICKSDTVFLKQACELPYPYDSPHIQATKLQSLYWLASWYDMRISFSDRHDPGMLCELIQSHAPSLEWAEKQRAYQAALSAAEKDVLKDYTFSGDWILNSYYREGVTAGLAKFQQILDDKQSTMGSFVFRTIFLAIASFDILSDQAKKLFLAGSTGKSLTAEQEAEFVRDVFNTPQLAKQPMSASLFTDSALITVMEAAGQLMREIFLKAPKLDRDIIVFRGDSWCKHFPPVDEPMQVKGFYSTTGNIRVALNFTGPGFCLTKLKVPRGKRCLIVLNSQVKGESEIIFDTDSVVTFKYCKQHTFAVMGQDKEIYGEGCKAAQLTFRTGVMHL